MAFRAKAAFLGLAARPPVEECPPRAGASRSHACLRPARRSCPGTAAIRDLEPCGDDKNVDSVRTELEARGQIDHVETITESQSPMFAEKRRQLGNCPVRSDRRRVRKFRTSPRSPTARADSVRREMESNAEIPQCSACSREHARAHRRNQNGSFLGGKAMRVGGARGRARVGRPRGLAAMRGVLGRL